MDKQPAQLVALQQAFASHYHQPHQLAFQAPGRVNLIGEHTDYNDGFVLPCAINFYTWVLANRRPDHKIRVLALDYQQQDEFDLSAPIAAHPCYSWANYVRGVANNLLQQGYELQGCDIAISGNVPKGAGLSSSASLEVALGLCLSTVSGFELSGRDNALNGQQAENQFVGCQCGIMDQLISALGQQGKALLIDTRSLGCAEVSIPQSLSVLIINSNVQRGLVDSAYNQRRQQCEAAARKLGLVALRDISDLELNQQLYKLSPLEAKRARHVVSENQRTRLAARALQQGDIRLLSTLMAQSHQSMQQDFEITVPAIDLLVQLVSAVVGNEGGVRMTGGGFGGCVVALLPSDKIAQVQAVVATEYPAKTGLKADIFVCEASQGATQL
ncbi:galactokinase [Rheinheimera sp. 4Y26]|uniref:galactokinase n=1 Tax=Rheinheimera sp. 4Y26 TaxID=2977811 RepID=UPI0021B15349|nr:galactokinase [Rheinheimera sp. 4Y26]MCT6698625.1 galactokinase [Rheinheimera sp. 4Y26]